MSGAEQSTLDEIGEQEPRRSREEILREFKLALTIGDGSLLEVDQDRARGVDPYDNRLGGRRAGLSGAGGSHGAVSALGAGRAGGPGLVGGHGSVTSDRPVRDPGQTGPGDGTQRRR